MTSKSFLSALLIIVVLLPCYKCITCPNMCSGHGSCLNGVCLCQPYWKNGDCSERVCPFGETYVDPTATTQITPGGPTPLKHAVLECSGQGICDGETGLCKCFEGYEGESCSRQSCPSNCNGHGVCTRMIDTSFDGNRYELDIQHIPTANVNQYWDRELSFTCVCDKEWEGYDCSDRRCPSGVVSTSDCEISSETVQEFDIQNIKTSFAGYLQYTDSFGRIWYTDLVEDLRTPALWKAALQKLPPGVIDLEKVTDQDGSTAPTNIADVESIVVKFGKQQTGLQPMIRIIGKSSTGESTTPPDYQLYSLSEGKARYPGGSAVGVGPGFHGMRVDSGAGLKDGATADVETVNSDPTTAFTSGLPPITCSGNGLCNRETGLCECFDGYSGIACTESSELI